MTSRWIVAGAAVVMATAGGAVLATQAGAVGGGTGGQEAAAVRAEAQEQADGSARAVLLDAAGKTVGVVTFIDGDKVTEVVAVFRKNANVAAGFHGFHIHANNLPDAGSGCVADAAADPATWFLSADGHLADAGETHGKHVGDMPSVYTLANGKARIAFAIDKIALSRLVGSAVMVHAGPDNFGNVPADQYTAVNAAAIDKTSKTGNAGNRVACGVITKS